MLVRRRQALDAHCLPIRRSHRVKGSQGRTLQEAEERNGNLSPSSDWWQRAWLLEPSGEVFVCVCARAHVCVCGKTPIEHEYMQRRKKKKSSITVTWIDVDIYTIFPLPPPPSSFLPKQKSPQNKIGDCNVFCKYVYLPAEVSVVSIP